MKPNDSLIIGKVFNGFWLTNFIVGATSPINLRSSVIDFSGLRYFETQIFLANKKTKLNWNLRWFEAKL